MSETIISSAIVLLAFIAIAFVFSQISSILFIKKRKKAISDLQNSISVGKVVVINNSLIGIVKKVGSEECVIELSKNVNVTVTRYSITQVKD